MDNYPKYILTRNDIIQKRNGIIHKNIPEFMANGEVFWLMLWIINIVVGNHDKYAVNWGLED